MKILFGKAAVDKEWEKLEKIPSWDLCRHLNNAELETNHQKYSGRVVLRGDIVNDDFRFFAVLTEQRSSVSQMIAAKVMDIISRLSECVGQAADAVFVNSQVTIQNYWRIPNRNVPTYGYVHKKTNGQNHFSV